MAVATAAPVAPAVPTTRTAAGRIRPAVAVGGLALAAAVWAVAASAWFIPRLTDNGDEAVYLLQAESLRSGQLFPPAAEPAKAFLPWLSTPVGDHYVTKYTPLMGFAAALLAGVQRRSRAALVLAGLLLGLALFARPFDAVLVAGPVLVWWIWSGRQQARRLAGEAAWLGMGAIPPLAAMAVYFQVATGSFLRPPFTFVGPSDTLGFGPKRMYAGMPFVDYTPARAVLAFGRLTVLTGFWGFGGLLLVGLAVVGYRSLGRGAGRWLALVAATVPLGYLFFWGSFSSSEWGGPWRFGPFYWLPVLIPTSILAAAGFARLRRWDRTVARFVAVGMAAVSVFVTVRAVGEHQRLGALRARLYAAPLAATASLDRAVVFLPPLDGPYLLQPFSLARNATFDGPVVWAVDRGPHQNLDVVSHLAGRTPYRVLPGATHRDARVVAPGQTGRQQTPGGTAAGGTGRRAAEALDVVAVDGLAPGLGGSPAEVDGAGSRNLRPGHGGGSRQPANPDGAGGGGAGGEEGGGGRDGEAQGGTCGAGDDGEGLGKLHGVIRSRWLVEAWTADERGGGAPPERRPSGVQRTSWPR
ncbi:MAG: hypothetical protein LC792_05215 [Actinobacteria bacterium]|nr:hypothetical protein [Actinomycetota bacterium]